MPLEPAAAATVPPMHVVDASGWAATARPVGSDAVNARLVVCDAFALLSIVNVSRDI
jgi:hypothetical protein